MHHNLLEARFFLPNQYVTFDTAHSAMQLQHVRVSKLLLRSRAETNEISMNTNKYEWGAFYYELALIYQVT